MFKSMLVAVAAITMVGCAAKNETVTPAEITLKYNNSLTDFMDVVIQANEHCSQYAKIASLSDTSLSPFGAWHTHTRTFRCE